MILEPSNKVVFFSRFHPLPDAGGGCRRTAQIIDALKGFDYAFASTRDYKPKEYQETREYKEYLKEPGSPTAYLEKWETTRRGDIAHMHYVSWLWDKGVNDSDLEMALVDDPIYFEPLVRGLALKGVPIVAFSQNIESLSKVQVVEEYQLELLIRELEVLSLCAFVICISREETFLLKNLGINALYYPYYPVKLIEDRMLSIRAKRSGVKHEDFLLLGTAANPPTMAGMKEMMLRWKDIKDSLGGARLIVGGFGTDPLKNHADGKDVIFKGMMTNEDLDAALSYTKGAIVYQAGGSGALTKICEFLIAGVPVIVNSHAARSYHNLSGVYEFTDMSDIGVAAKQAACADAAITLPAHPNDEAMASCIKDIRFAASPINTKELKKVVSASIASLTIGKRLPQADAGDEGWKKMVYDMMAEHENKLLSEKDRIIEQQQAYIEAVRGTLAFRIYDKMRKFIPV